MAASLKITVLGSGTSVGVPTIGCHCDVCTSADPRDNRLRPSILIGYDGRNILVDTTPDFRAQALRARIDRLDAIVYTHAHADHMMGLDDVRPFNFRQKGQIPVYASEATMAAIRRCFQYVFDDVKRDTHIPKLDTHIIDGAAFDLFGLEFTPIPILHGPQTIYGFRFGPAAYLTDHHDIPEESLENCAAWTCCSWMRCGTNRTRRIRRSNARSRPSRRWRHGGHSSPTSRTTFRTHAPKSFCLHMSGWRMTVWKSK